MKRHISYLIVLTTLLLVASCSKKDDRVTVPTNDGTQTMEEQVATLEQQVEKMKNTITVLENANAVLEKYADSLNTAGINAAKNDLQISTENLKKYVDNCSTANRDWASGTFATLAHYDTLCLKISRVLLELSDSLLPICREIAKEAVKYVKDDMKGWVNEKLDGYWKIEQMQAEIDKLKDEEGVDVKNLHSDISSARKELDAAYKEAMESAISDYDGKLNETLDSILVSINKKLDARINDIDLRISNLEMDIYLLSRKIQTLEGQDESILKTIEELKKADKTMDDYLKALYQQIEELKTERSGHTQAIEKLERDAAAAKNTSENLKKEIDNLTSYASTLLKEKKEWAAGTFATLERFDSLCRVVTSVEASVNASSAIIAQLPESVLQQCQGMVSEAIAATTASMKQWVNKKLTDNYWTIAQTSAKLDRLKLDLESALKDSLRRFRSDMTDLYESRISAEAKQLSRDLTKSCQKEIDDATAEMKSKITKAVNNAINDLNGRFSDEVNSEVVAFSARITQKINELDSTKIAGVQEILNDLVARMNLLDQRLSTYITRIQSIVPVPDYDDGLFRLTPDESTSNLNFKILPDTAAKHVIELWNSSPSSFSVEYRTTKPSLSSTSNDAYSIPIRNISLSDGTVKVQIDHSAFPNGLWSGESGVVVCFAISDGGDLSISSKYTGVFFNSTISSSITSDLLRIGSSMTAEVSITPAQTAYSAVWSSSDSNVVKVTKLDDSHATIKAVAEGIAIITVETKFKSDYFEVTSIPTNVIPGLYSTSLLGRVMFAHGNLKYTARSNKFDFENYQYFKIGNAYGNTTRESSRKTQSAAIDLFGWATTFNTFSEAPYSASTTNKNYKSTPYESSVDESLSHYNHADWGYTLNYGADEWRTLSKKEWEYILLYRKNAADKYGFGTVTMSGGRVQGLILVPDYFTDPCVNGASGSDGKFVPKSRWSNVEANTYTSSNWEKMEKNGAVFLPAGGVRSGTSVNDDNTRGAYWSADANSDSGADALLFTIGSSSNANVGGKHRSEGCSVRLVKSFNY